MEDILHLYHLPNNAQRPIVCFDELPVQLLGEVVTPLVLTAGQPKRVDYEYERHGSCALLVAFEPLTGTRLVEVSKQRTKADYCRVMHRVAADVFGGGQNRPCARQLEDAHLEFVLRELAARRSLCVGANIRAAVHAATRRRVAVLHHARARKVWAAITKR